MHIVFCANNEYVDEVLTCVSYISKTQKNYHLHILGDNLTNDNIARLEGNNISVAQFKDHKDMGDWWRPNFLKLYIPQYFPELDKVIYLDTDTITLRKLDRLWNIDITDYYAGCVKNIITPKACMAKHYCEFDIPENTDIANLGVMVINCKSWRKHRITSRLIQFTVDVITKLEHSYAPNVLLARIQKEEFSFNSLLIGKWLELEERWNVVPVSKINKPYIIHTWHDPSSIYK